MASVDPRFVSHPLSLFSLDCYWVGSLDFKFWDTQVFSTKPPKRFQLFAGGSSASLFSVDFFAGAQEEG